MMTLNSNVVAKKRGRPLGSKNKSKKRAFKRSNTSNAKQKAPKLLPIGATSWQDAYDKTYANLKRAYERLVELQDAQDELDQAKVDLAGLSTIINYLELRLEDKYKETK